MAEERLEALFRRHAHEVFAYALRRTDATTAEEVVSEVFAVAWRRPERIPDEDPVLWLYGVARRVLANERRAARRRDALTSALAPLARDRAADSPARGELLGALAALRSSDREVLLLTAWEGLDARQAAVVLGCTPEAVHTRLHRARRRLEEQLATGVVPASVRCAEVNAP